MNSPWEVLQSRPMGSYSCWAVPSHDAVTSLSQGKTCRKVSPVQKQSHACTHVFLESSCFCSPSPSCPWMKDSIIFFFTADHSASFFLALTSIFCPWVTTLMMDGKEVQFPAAHRKVHPFRSCSQGFPQSSCHFTSFPKFLSTQLDSFLPCI